jgi:enoyl-CoA hydratase/carnithine racemase
MSTSLVLRSDADGVATVTLNRPEKLNALSPALFLELRAIVDALAADDSVGCVVLTGAGRAFCAGNDLAAIGGREPLPTPNFQSETVDAIENLPQPVIARINGHCYTGGLELALACDLLVAGESASLGDTHGQWGLVPVWGMSVRLPERVGRSNAKELMFTARRVPGREAKEMGLVDHCVPDDQLDATVADLARRIVANSWGTNRRAKKLLAASATTPRAEALLYERTLPFGMPEDMAERLSTSPQRR